MENLIDKKSKLKTKIGKLKKKIFDLENELYMIEKEQSKFTYVDLLEQLTLNEQQKQVVFSDDKNMLVIACPGSGKTHTLISRYIYNISKGDISSEETILITFTKKIWDGDGRTFIKASTIINAKLCRKFTWFLF